MSVAAPEPPSAAPPVEAKSDVRLDREMREERRFLRDISDSTLLGRDVVVIVFDDGIAECHGASVGMLESGEDAQQCGLPAARRPQDGGEGSRGNEQVDSSQDLYRAE